MLLLLLQTCPKQVRVVVVARCRADLRRTQCHRQRAIAVRVASAAASAAAANCLAEAVLRLVEVLVGRIVVVVAGRAARLRPSTSPPLADVTRRFLALVEDGGEDEDVEKEQAAADRHSDAEWNGAVTAAREQRAQQLVDCAARGCPWRRWTRCRRRARSRRQRRWLRRWSLSASNGVSGAWSSGRGVDGRRHRGRCSVGALQLVESRQVDTVSVETARVVKVVEKMKALVEVVWTVDLWNEIKPQSHLGSSQMMTDHWPTVCYNITWYDTTCLYLTSLESWQKPAYSNTRVTTSRKQKWENVNKKLHWLNGQCTVRPYNQTLVTVW